MGITIKLVNSNEVVSGLLLRKGRVPGALNSAAKKSIPIIDGNVKSLCPIDTGQLVGSYHGIGQAAGSQAHIWYGSNGAFSESGYNYGPVQEYVHRPHLRPGFWAAIPAIKQIFIQELAGAL